jgi:hypothetical protein
MHATLHSCNVLDAMGHLNRSQKTLGDKLAYAVLTKHNDKCDSILQLPGETRSQLESICARFNTALRLPFYSGAASKPSANKPVVAASKPSASKPVVAASKPSASKQMDAELNQAIDLVMQSGAQADNTEQMDAELNQAIDSVMRSGAQADNTEQLDAELNQAIDSVMLSDTQAELAQSRQQIEQMNQQMLELHDDNLETLTKFSQWAQGIKGSASGAQIAKDTVKLSSVQPSQSRALSSVNQLLQ